jgi:hypothetical protein
MIVYTEEQIHKMIGVAEDVVDRANKGLPVDRWASTDEMKMFVLAYQYVMQTVAGLAMELDALDEGNDFDIAIEVTEHRIQ